MFQGNVSVEYLGDDSGNSVNVKGVSFDYVTCESPAEQVKQLLKVEVVRGQTLRGWERPLRRLSWPKMTRGQDVCTSNGAGFWGLRVFDYFGGGDEEGDAYRQE